MNNFKLSVIKDHANSTGHTDTIAREMEKRQSSLAKKYDKAKEVNNQIKYNAFLSTYWLGKEEIANKKLPSLVNIEEQIGMEQMGQFKQKSQRSQKGMHLLLGQLIKDSLISRVKRAKYFSILVNEVTDCSVTEHVLVYIGYVDEKGESHFEFLDVRDALADSDSADAKTITRIIKEELVNCGIKIIFLCGFASGGASFMTGACWC